MYVTVNVEPYGTMQIMLLYNQMFGPWMISVRFHECWDRTLILFSHVRLHGGTTGDVYTRGLLISPYCDLLSNVVGPNR
jgi:hypothetical protein